MKNKKIQVLLEAILKKEKDGSHTIVFDFEKLNQVKISNKKLW